MLLGEYEMHRIAFSAVAMHNVHRKTSISSESKWEQVCPQFHGFLLAPPNPLEGSC